MSLTVRAIKAAAAASALITLRFVLHSLCYVWIGLWGSLCS